jgi:hypothetical protein
MHSWMNTFNSIMLLNVETVLSAFMNWLKKSSRTQKQTQTHHCCKVIEGPAGGPEPKGFRKRVPSRQSQRWKMKNNESGWTHLTQRLDYMWLICPYVYITPKIQPL